MFYYRPIAEYAYTDMKYLDNDMPFGSSCARCTVGPRTRWSSSSGCTCSASFMTGSYKPPREFNWIVGVLLLVLDAAFEFHRLPAAVGSAGDLGGHGRLQHGARDAAPRLRGTVRRLRRRQSDLRRARLSVRRRRDRPHTLLRFYILHCIFIPLVASILMAVHFWRIRRDGFSGPSF